MLADKIERCDRGASHIRERCQHMEEERERSDAPLHLTIERSARALRTIGRSFKARVKSRPRPEVSKRLREYHCP